MRGSDSKVLLNNRGEAVDEGLHVQLKVSSERNPSKIVRLKMDVIQEEVKSTVQAK